MNKLKHLFHALKHYLNGDFAYEKYLEHHHKIHPQKAALSKKDFLRKKEKDKWGNVNRCC